MCSGSGLSPWVTETGGYFGSFFPGSAWLWASINGNLVTFTVVVIIRDLIVFRIRKKRQLSVKQGKRAGVGGIHRGLEQALGVKTEWLFLEKGTDLRFSEEGGDTCAS